MTPQSLHPDPGSCFDGASAIRMLSLEGDRLIAALESTEPSAAVPYCPGWTATDLAIHLAGVFRWVNTVVSERRPTPPAGDERRRLFADPEARDWTGLLERLRDATGAIVANLRDAPTDLTCWTIWEPPGTARQFWVRRLLFETLVHRVDAENARSHRVASGSEIDAALAADGVDELMCGFARRYEATLRSERDITLAVRPTDADRVWWAEIGPGSPRFGRGEPANGATSQILGASGELLLALWNRREPEGLQVQGDAEAIKVWRAGAHL